MKTAISPTRTPITFTLFHSDEEIVIETYTGAYRNLMVLLNERVYLENFGECGGMGRCGTCLIEVTDVKNQLSSMERNEANTMNKAGITTPGIRLACQIQIDEDLHDSVIRIHDI